MWAEHLSNSALWLLPTFFLGVLVGEITRGQKESSRSNAARSTSRRALEPRDRVSTLFASYDDREMFSTARLRVTRERAGFRRSPRSIRASGAASK